VPEGDSVWRAARQLHQALSGQQLTASHFRVPRFATLNLAGWTVDEVVARGKHLLIRVHGPDDQKLTIHSHLKMEGTWQVYPPGGRWRKPGFTARCVLRTAAAEAAGFSLGIVEVVRTVDEDSVVGHLGPDLLGPDWDPAEAERRIGQPLTCPLVWRCWTSATLKASATSTAARPASFRVSTRRRPFRPFRISGLSWLTRNSSWKPTWAPGAG
jgi:endonuclease-8